MSSPTTEVLEFVNKNISLMLSGFVMILLWLIRILGSRVINEFVTKKQLLEALEEHSEKVKEERKEETKRSEERIAYKVIDLLKESGIRFIG